MTEPAENVSSGPHRSSAVHVASFSATAVGPVITISFFGIAGSPPGLPPVIVPAFTGVFLPEALIELRDVLNTVLTSIKTLRADETKPQ